MVRVLPFIPLLFSCLLQPASQTRPADDGWRSLFNGRDLAGWEIYLAWPMHGQ